MSKLSSNRGFTLVEMVVTVAVMAILVGLSMPAIFEYMRQRDNQEEDIKLNEVSKALKAYLAGNGILPDDASTTAWATALAGYTSLSEDEIANDFWGRPRTYVMYSNTTRTIGSTPVTVYYATIHSKGVNGDAEKTYKDSTGTAKTITGLAVTSKNFDGSSNGSWWAGKGTDALVTAAYASLRPGGDDHMLRFTNYSEVLDNYNTTVQRLDSVTKALETYARSQYADRVAQRTADCAIDSTSAACKTTVPEQSIYYPRALPSESINEVVSGASKNVIYASTTTIVNNSSSSSARTTQMKRLVNMLGLPDEFCCSALETYSVTASGVTTYYPAPFYYFSNPRPRTSGSCGTRPTTDVGKLPARVTTSNDANKTCG